MVDAKTKLNGGRRPQMIALCLIGGASLLSVLHAEARNGSTNDAAFPEPKRERLKSFATSVRHDLLLTGASATDMNFVLRPLIDAGLIDQVKEPCGPIEQIRQIPTLVGRNNVWVMLDKLRTKLRPYPDLGKGYRPSQIVMSDEPDTDPDQSTQSRLNTLLGVSKVYRTGAILKEPPKPTQPLRWARAMRIASTGSSVADKEIAEIIVRLRKANPALPLDDRSFPNSIAQANVFLDAGGVRCVKGRSCQGVVGDPGKNPKSDAQFPQMDTAPIKFFGELNRDIWTSRAPIYVFQSSARSREAVAWIRTDAKGVIRGVACTHVIGLGDSGERAAGRAIEMKRTIGECLLTAMGAPAGDLRWSLLSLQQDVPSTCPEPSGASDIASQVDVLRMLYSPRSRR